MHKRLPYDFCRSHFSENTPVQELLRHLRSSRNKEDAAFTLESRTLSPEGRLQLCDDVTFSTLVDVISLPNTSNSVKTALLTACGNVAVTISGSAFPRKVSGTINLATVDITISLMQEAKKDSQKVELCRVLGNLACVSENRETIGSRVIPFLVNSLHIASDSLSKAILKTLSNLAISKDNQSNIGKTNAISILLRLMNTPENQSIAQHASEALCRTVYYSDSLKNELVNLGGAPALLRASRRKISPVDKVTFSDAQISEAIDLAQSKEDLYQLKTDAYSHRLRPKYDAKERQL